MIREEWHWTDKQELLIVHWKTIVQLLQNDEEN